MRTTWKLYSQVFITPQSVQNLHCGIKKMQMETVNFVKKTKKQIQIAKII